MPEAASYLGKRGRGHWQRELTARICSPLLSLLPPVLRISGLHHHTTNNATHFFRLCVAEAYLMI
jgi:hypothetical protein